jgi:DNA-binding MarR family transcriptional regulator
MLRAYPFGGSGLKQEVSDTDLDAASRLAIVDNAIGERARRFDHFRADLFADPAWDILLQLYASELAQELITVSQLVEKSRVPSTTTVRWINMLECDSLITRRIDPHEGRVFVALTQKGSEAMNDYFSRGAE